jgi:hypothetical protein
MATSSFASSFLAKECKKDAETYFLSNIEESIDNQLDIYYEYHWNNDLNVCAMLIDYYFSDISGKTYLHQQEIYDVNEHIRLNRCEEKDCEDKAFLSDRMKYMESIKNDE